MRSHTVHAASGLFPVCLVLHIHREWSSDISANDAEECRPEMPEYNEGWTNAPRSDESHAVEQISQRFPHCTIGENHVLNTLESTLRRRILGDEDSQLINLIQIILGTDVILC